MEKQEDLNGFAAAIRELSPEERPAYDADPSVKDLEQSMYDDVEFNPEADRAAEVEETKARASDA